MGYLDKVVGIVALLAGAVVLVGIMSTDAYSRGAKAQASGDIALTQLIVSDSDARMNQASSQFAANDIQQVVTQ